MNGVLLLEDGTRWEGQLFGALKPTTGEVVFNTSMSGYEEILTDPSYCRQVVAFTNPMLGNYGITLQDGESPRPWVEAVIVREHTPLPDSWRSELSLGAYLALHDIPGLAEVDTRGVVRHVRTHGAQRCVVGPADHPDLEGLLKAQPPMLGLGLAHEVSGSHRRLTGPGPRVAVLDLGVKAGILRELTARGLDVVVFPSKTPAAEILAANPQGLVLSNGPGDPAALPELFPEVRKLVTSGLPTLAICLGHQLTALSLGAKSYKLKFGHRGGNHPVQHMLTGKVEISSHNHGFAISAEDLPKELEATHVDLYDGTLEGFRHRELPVQCVQYHPESSPGPRDSLYLFDDFVRSLETCHSAKI